MRDLLIPFILGAVVVPVYADSSITTFNEGLSFSQDQVAQLWTDSDSHWHLASNSSNQNRNRNRGKNNNQNRERNNNRNVQQNASPVRTRVYTGLNYNEADFEDGWNTKTLTKTLFDATTIFNDQFRLSYGIDEVTLRSGEGNRKQEDRVNYSLTPRFNQWVSPNFNYHVQGTYRRSFRRNSQTQTVYRLKTGGNWNFGQNSYSLSTQYSHVDHNGNKTWNINPGYNRRISQRMNTNFSAGYSRTKKENNDDGSYNFNASAGVNYRFTSYFRANMNFQYGENGNDDGYGYKSYTVNFNTTTELNHQFDLIANIGYQKADRYYRDYSDLGNGNRTRFTGKLGIRTEF